MAVAPTVKLPPASSCPLTMPLSVPLDEMACCTVHVMMLIGKQVNVAVFTALSWLNGQLKGAGNVVGLG